ncbi:MAG: hypothetical protein ACK56I_11325, partial [bacterium]
SITFSRLADFTADRGIFHAVSPLCNRLRGATNFDSILGISASILAWISILPVTFVVASILVPGPINSKSAEVLPVHIADNDTKQHQPDGEIDNRSPSQTQTTPQRVLPFKVMWDIALVKIRNILGFVFIF